MQYQWMTLLIIPIFLCSCQGNKTQEEETEANTLSDYREPHRNQYHFSPDSMWMNDPNGMVYHDGKYHLFYQYYPDSTVWGPMHWGHAVSSDLVHWTHKSIALYPDELGYIFSGSAVYDLGNTSGLGSEDNPPLVAIYTYHDAEKEKQGDIKYQTQGIAYSLDSGDTWKKYEGNPIIENRGIRDFRDPKVSWYEKGGYWLMALAVKDHIRFYQSPDLKTWTNLSEFGHEIGAHGGVWECPDLFPLTAEDGTTRWILFVSINPGGPQGGSATQYFVGDFDGITFTPDDEKIRWLDHGADNYAGVTWSNVSDRRIFIGWMSNWQYGQIVPTKRWRSAMTLPRELSLVPFGDEYIVRSEPVKELGKITKDSKTISEPQATFDVVENLSLPNATYRLTTTAPSDTSWHFNLKNDAGAALSIGYDQLSGRFYIDRTSAGNTGFHEAFGARHFAPRLSDKEQIEIEVFVDQASVEVFFDGGNTVMTDLFFAEDGLPIIELGEEGSVNPFSESDVAGMERIW
jgi:fructan beta-fructosidase